jgi:hypothetical protein
MVQAIKALVNDARWAAGYEWHETMWVESYHGSSRRAYVLAWFYWSRSFLRTILDHMRYAIGAQVCKRRGHSKHILLEEHVHGTRSADGKRWDDIDGASIEWFCPRCGQSGSSWW